MLRKGWDRSFRGLAAFDLSTGLFVPFLIATSCVVIAAASQFHARFDEKLISQPAADINGSYKDNLEKRVKADAGSGDGSILSQSELDAKIDALPRVDRKLAYMLIKRDSLDLASALENLFGKGGLTQKVFGIGVLGMAISTIVILMVINGFCVTEMTQRDGDRVVQRLGAILPGIVGGFGFLALWGDDQARFWLAVPTSNFGMVLLPIAYIAFFFMMNNPSLLGDAMPRGVLRIIANVVMLAAISAASIGAGLSVWENVGWIGVAFAAGFVVISVVNAGSRQTALLKRQ